MTKTRASNKWMTLILVAFAGGIITKLPYLRETYMAPLMEATGANATQLGLIMLWYRQLYLLFPRRHPGR